MVTIIVQQNNETVMNKQETGRGFLPWIVLLAGSMFARALYARMNRTTQPNRFGKKRKNDK
jgi:hypothetical protein